jgi:WD40 repeat protein
MSETRGRLFGTACLLVLLIQPIAAEPPRTDDHGDPLPPGAVARLGTVRLRHIVRDGSGAACVVFTPDGKTLISGGDVGLCAWDVATGKELGWFRDALAATAACFMPDGKTLLTVDNNGSIRRWLPGTGTLLREMKPPEDYRFRGSASFLSSDGKVAGAASFRQHVNLSGSPRAAFTSDLTTLAVWNYQEIDVWDAATGKERTTLSEHRGEVCCLAFNSDDKTLAAASSRYYGKDYKHTGDLKLWDVASGKERATLPGPFGDIRAMAVSPDGKMLALLDRPELYAEDDLKLVDVGTGRQWVLRVPPTCSFLAPHFTTDGKLLVTGLSVDALRLWEVSLPKRDGKP